MTTTAATIEVDTGVQRSLRSGTLDLVGRLFRVLLQLALLVSVTILAVLVYDVVSGGSSVLTERLGSFLTGSLASRPETSGLSQALRGTFFIGVFTVVFAFPLGLMAAIYLEEYAHAGRLTRFIDINVRNLAGVPSVVFGILGLTMFVNALRSVTGPDSAGRTVISAGLTLAVLVLPIVIITSVEALRAVPTGLREARFGVGATKWEVVRHHVLPYAAPGILTGTILALARALGEAAPLILVGAATGFLTTGDSYSPGSMQDRFTAMPIAITTWAGRPGANWEAVTSAAIVVLLAMVLMANAAAIVLRNRFERRRS